jgi:histidinol-phosphate aminotransferase
MPELTDTRGRIATERGGGDGLSEPVKLSFNEMPWPPLPAVTDAITRFLHGPNSVNRYPDMRASELRAVIAAHHGVPTECVAVGTGSSGLLYQLMFAWTRSDDEVLMPWPTFGQYATYATWTGASATRVPLAGTTPSGPQIAAAITSRTRMIVIATPNNPTGTVLRIDGLKALLSAAPTNCIVVLDQAYQDFVTASHAPDAANLVATHTNFVVLRTFSKSHALAGLRAGYVLAHPDTVRVVERLAVPFNIDGIAQVAAVASLRAFAQVQERVNIIVRERERVVAELRGRGFGQANTQANFVWLPVGAAAAELAAALERSGVLTRCIPDYGVRVTIGTPEENDRFLDAFGAGDHLVEYWGLPTGADAMRVHGWVQQLLDPDLRARVDVQSARECLRRCEAVACGTAVPAEPLLDASQVLDAIADLVADTRAEALPLLEIEVAGLLRRISSAG